MKEITSFLLIAFVMMAFLFPACAQGHTTLVIGVYNNMHIDNELAVWAWGSNLNGELGQGDNIQKPTPQPVTLSPALGGDAVSLCAGWAHICVLDSNKDVACTGRDEFGQVGSGDSRADMNVLTPAVGVSDVAHLGCGYRAGLATTTTGKLMVWGRDTYAQLGLGTSAPSVWEAVEVSFFCLRMYTSQVISC
jgi:alpha-tubulin suppressor-like RCC1 family protein